MHVTALVENSRLEGRTDLGREHGLSIHIQLEGHSVLFDTGASAAFLANARALAIAIEDVDVAALSHHHYDHGGGLGHFLAVNSKAHVFLKCPPQGDLRFRALGLINRVVGLDPALFERFSSRFRFIDEPTEIAPGVFLLTDIARTHALPAGNRHLVIERAGARQADPFEHELMMVIQEGDGIVVLTGCSHGGVRNMLDTASTHFPGQRIKALFGGLHLIGLPFLNTMAGTRAEVQSMGRALLDHPVERVFTGHCTGPKALRVLKDVMAERLELFPTGASVEV